MAIIGNSISKASKLLMHGELIGLPTETVYGLAGNALNPEAVSKIFEVKNRPSFDPLILHCANISQIEKLTTTIPKKAYQLAKEFWPGPLTLLLHRNETIPDITCAGLERAAFRIPQHKIALQLLEELEFPLAAPSANPFGYISPTSAQHVDKQLGNKIKYILDGKISQVGIESTIVGFEQERVIIYRLGGLDVNAIEAIVGPVEVLPYSSSSPAAPGMLKSHYSPKKKIILGNIDALRKAYPAEKTGILSYSKIYTGVAESYQLSRNCNMHEAAKNLFSYLRILDDSDIDVIISELAPNEGLGKAINDRLKRASV
jgi:L-threonylcarbamoyladenylate synthase